MEDALLVPPLFYCVIDWLRLVWNSTTQEPEGVPYAHIHTGQIGDINALNYLDTLFFDIHFVPSYEFLVGALVDAGYQKGVDLFGVPYDWRFGPRLPAPWYNSFISFIENSVNVSGDKAILVSHSMGCMVSHYLLMNLTTHEWREKYIDSMILLAPSICGAGGGFNALWTEELPGLEILGPFPDMVPFEGGVHTHIANFDVFRDKVIYVAPDGTERKAPDATELLIENGKFPGDSKKIYDLFEAYHATAPVPLDMPIAVFYNSKLQTPMGINRSSGADVVFFGGGDKMVNREGPEYICSKWKTGKAIDCFDLNSDSGHVDHGGMLWNQVLLDFVVQHVINSSWQDKI
jgi:hypothetical protein